MAREKRVYFLRSGNLTEKSRSKDSKLEILIWKTTSFGRSHRESWTTVSRSWNRSTKIRPREELAETIG